MIQWLAHVNTAVNIWFYGKYGTSWSDEGLSGSREGLCSMKSDCGLVGCVVHNLCQFSPGWLSSRTLLIGGNQLVCVLLQSHHRRTLSSIRTQQPGSLPDYQVDPYRLLEDDLKDVYDDIREVRLTIRTGREWNCYPNTLLSKLQWDFQARA